MRCFLLFCLVFVISCGDDVPRPVRDFEGLDLALEEDNQTLDLGGERGFEFDFEVVIKPQSFCDRYDCDNLVDTVDVSNRRVGDFNFDPQPFEFDMG